MRVTFYSAVVLIAAGSVIFGLDWVPAPMPPMPQAKNIVFVPPPPPPAPRAVATPAAAPPSTPAPQTSPDPVAAPATPPPVAQAPAPVAAPPIASVPRIKCDVDACEAAYRSFRESDCTYNPSFGPRRLCTKGDPDKYAREHPQVAAPVAPSVPPPPAAETAPVAQTAEPGAITAPGTTPAAAAAPPRCNVSACAAAYPRSFRAEDCTFNPSSGPRRVCEK